jgi:hypothetical protein
MKNQGQGYRYPRRVMVAGLILALWVTVSYLQIGRKIWGRGGRTPVAMRPSTEAAGSTPTIRACTHFVEKGIQAVDSNGAVCRWAELTNQGCCPSHRPCSKCRGCFPSHVECTSCCLGCSADTFGGCLSRCRHNSSMIVHQNRYKSKFHHCL